MAFKRGLGQWLGQHVSRLLLGVDSLERERSILPARVLHEVEVLGVDVLGPGAHPRNLSNRQRTIVILEGFTIWTTGPAGTMSKPNFCFFSFNMCVGEHLETL